MKSYCSQLVVEGADLSPGAKGCEESDTYYVRRSLANKMFTHCGAHYLYDYDTPSAVCYEWNGSEKCWSRGTACKTHEMGQRLVARKALMCKIPMVSVPKRRCKGTPYTYNEAKGCNGWSSLTEKQCMEKCSSNARAKNCPQKTCRAAVFYKDSGWCHLYDSCEELEDFERSTHLGDKVPMSQVEGRVCSGLLPFTYNTGVGCDGWGGITQEQCAQRCVGNQRAPNCPQKICVAAVFYKSTGWCHLYDECSQLEARKSATLIVPEGTQVEAWDCDKIEQSRCSQSFTRSKVGNYFVQCSVASNGQRLSGGGICQALAHSGDSILTMCMMRWRRMLLAVALLTASTRGQDSIQCRNSLVEMLRDPNWMHVNNSQTRWCRLRLENTMATCCRIANFADGKGEDCSGCTALCLHQNMITLCNQHFGQACVVRRKPFFKTGAPDVEVHETFCVPQECNNGPDRDALISRYGASFATDRFGWHLDYNEAVLECPSGVIGPIIVTVVVIACILLCIPISIFLFKAPKERGRTLISQEQMQAESMREDDDLRGAGAGGDTLGSSGMQATR